MAKSRIKISQKEVEELSEKHNELRFFTVNGVLLELTGNDTTEDGHLMHHVKNVKTGKYKRRQTLDGSLGDIIPISDVDLKKLMSYKEKK